MSDELVIRLLIAWWLAVMLFDAVRTIRHIGRPSRDLPCDSDEGRAPCSSGFSQVL